MHTYTGNTSVCQKTGRLKRGSAGGKFVLGAFLFSLLLLMLMLCGLATADEVRLATVHPGPYALVVDWGVAEETEIELTWGNHSQRVAARPGWQSIPLPTPFSPLHFPLAWRSKSSLHPRMLLYAKGDPLELVPTRNGLEPRVLAGPTPPKTDTVMSFALPEMTPDRYAVSLVTSNGPEGTRNCPATITIGAFSAQTMVAAKQTIVTALKFTPSSSPEPSVMTIHTHGKDCPNISSLRIQPLHDTLESTPFQTGVYYFQTFDKLGRPLGPVGRYLRAGHQTPVRSEGALIGGTVSFSPHGQELVSTMDNDTVFAFNGFHDREHSPTAHPFPPFQRWTASPEAEIILRLPPEADAEIALRLLTSCPETVHPGNALISVEGQDLRLLFENGSWEDRILVPATQRRSETVAVKISSRLWKPSEVMDSRDERQLGLLLDRLSVELHPPSAEDEASPRLPRP